MSSIMKNFKQRIAQTVAILALSMAGLAAVPATAQELTLRISGENPAAGFDLRPGTHPICPVMLYDAPLAQRFAQRLLEEGVYAIGFFFPVVPKGQARIRTQMSAAHTREHLDQAIDAFVRVGRELGVLQR